MGIKVKKEKDFDAVKLQHKLRTELSKKIKGMTVEEELQFFKEAAERGKKRRARK